MTQDLNSFYSTVQSVGNLRTEDHAKRWTQAVMQTLGLNISGSAKKKLKNALPKGIGDHLSDVFWLFNFRNTNMTASYFQERVGRRAGNTDREFAKFPTLGVFAAIQEIVSENVSQSVAKSLSPELKEMWEKAPTFLPAEAQVGT